MTIIYCVFTGINLHWIVCCCLLLEVIKLSYFFAVIEVVFYRDNDSWPNITVQSNMIQPHNYDDTDGCVFVTMLKLSQALFYYCIRCPAFWIDGVGLMIQ